MNWSEIFTYNNGNLYWKIQIGRKIKIGALAGNLSKSTGYICIKYQGVTYKAQNIIWEMHNGKIPKGYLVDHDNHIRHDNEINNLNLIKKEDNLKNKLIGKNNKSGLMGVRWVAKRNKWVAYINDKGKTKHIGYFDERQEAVDARLTYEKKLGYNPKHNSRLS